MEMEAQVVANIVPIFVALAPSCYITTMLELLM
jgi:hypothetical protein